jgi:hypothetical protein
MSGRQFDCEPPGDPRFWRDESDRQWVQFPGRDPVRVFGPEDFEREFGVSFSEFCEQQEER